MLEFEVREPPQNPALIAAARSGPDTWIYEIDRVYSTDQPVPSEAIRGSWEVDVHGQMTGRFVANNRYRPVEYTTRTLKPYLHAAAKTNRNQWIVEIDARGESSFPDIPPHLIRGWWYVNAAGLLTGEFRPNSLWSEADAAMDAQH
jgi:hypothetical protein